LQWAYYIKIYRKSNSFYTKFHLLTREGVRGWGYLHLNVAKKASYFDVSFIDVGRARVRKYALFWLQICAVCKNLSVGVSKLYFASKIYSVLNSSSVNLNSFESSFV
jgi:hypothetical protein